MVVNTPSISKLGRVYIDEEYYMFRIVDSDESTYYVMDEGGNIEQQSKRSMTKNIACNSLTPSGIMAINLVDIVDGLDVVVAFYRTADLSKGIDRPFVAGRQSIINILAAQFCTNLEQLPYGLWLSRVTCPSDFDMDQMLLCKDIVESRIICLYPFDTCKTIVELAKPTDKFDSAINNFRVIFDPKGTKTVGSTLYEFLDNTGWQSEFNRANGIYVLNDEIFFHDTKSDLLYYQDDESPEYNYDALVYSLEHILNHRVTVLDVVEYNPRYDLREIGNDAFAMVRNYDDSNMVFIVKYILGDPLVFVPKSQKLMASQLMSKLGISI